MPSCFVIQPFDPKFDKRFEDVYKPAVIAAGLEPYRVDRDPGADILIEAIEAGIRRAALCLADITTDNPNVWYELGYAFATDCPVVMVCSEERSGKKYPFDIQHRSIISYGVDAPSDFEKLRQAVTVRLESLLTRDEALRKMAKEEQVAPVGGLSQIELLVLAGAAGSVVSPQDGVSLYSVRQGVEGAGVTNLGCTLAIRGLVAKGFVRMGEEEDLFGPGTYQVLTVTEIGWDWIESNKSKFVLVPSNIASGVLRVVSWKAKEVFHDTTVSRNADVTGT